MTSCVYFIRVGTDGPIKVGTAIDVSKRLSQLQTAHHERLQLLASIPGNAQLEKHIHLYLASHRIRGEWFRHDFDVDEVCRLFNQEASADLGKQLTMYEQELEGELFSEKLHTLVEYWQHRLGTEPYFIDETIGEVAGELTTHEVFEAIDAVDRDLSAGKQLRALISNALVILSRDGRQPGSLATFDLSLVEGFNEYEATQEAKK